MIRRLLAVRHLTRLRVGAAIVLLLVAPSNASAQDGIIALLNANVVDVERGTLIRRQTIVVSEGHILDVGPGATTRVPRGAVRVDVAGSYVIPGLWDMHVHIGGRSPDAATSVGYFGALLLANGVTGVRDAGGDSRLLAAMDSIGRTKPGLMPRLLYSGEKIGPAPGESWTLADARSAIDARLTAGATFIKLVPSYPVELFRETYAICASLRVPCVAHVPPADTSVWLSAPGRGSFEHLFYLAEHVSHAPAADRFAEFEEYRAPTIVQRVLYKLGLRVYPQAPEVSRLAQRDTTRDRAFFARVAASGTWFTPTLILHHLIAPSTPLPPAAVDTGLARSPVVWNAGPTPAAVESRRRNWALSIGLLRSMHAAGVRMLAGTDFSRRHVPGAVLHAELALLQQQGIPAAEVLRMATLGPARYMGATDSLGTVAVGRVADLVILRANPLDDIRNVDSIRMVLTRGHLMRRAQLDSLTNAARAPLARLRAIIAQQAEVDWY
jgi:imidazolonepropionase-like amidohydrolase